MVHLEKIGQLAFVVCNTKSSPSLTILVPVWFIITSLVFCTLVNYYFEANFFNLKVILHFTSDFQASYCLQRWKMLMDIVNFGVTTE